MPEFLPQSSYADAGERFLEHYLEYTALTAEQETEEGRAEYCRHAQRRSFLGWHMLRGFSEDPLTDPNLSRLNWTMAATRPRLELTIFYNHRQQLILSAEPHEETVSYVQSRGWYGMLLKSSTDFKAFGQRGSTGRDDFSTSVLELDTGGVRFLNGLTHWGYVGEPERPAVNALERRMVAGLLRHKIYQLSLSFDCVLKTPFVLFGPDAIMELRNENGDDRFHQYGSAHRGAVDNYPGMNLLAEPAIQELAVQYGLDALKLHYFLQTYLFKKVPAELRQQTLAEYVMESQLHKIEPELLDLIDDYLNPDRRRARRIDEMAADPEGMAAFVERNRCDWANRLATALGYASVDDVYTWVEDVLPAIAASARYDHGYVRRKLEEHARTKRPPKRAVSSLSARMIQLWDEVMRPAPLSGFQKALDAAATGVGAGTHDQFVEWARTYCAPLQAHITERVQELRSLAEQRSRKARAVK